MNVLRAMALLVLLMFGGNAQASVNHPSEPVAIGACNADAASQKQQRPNTYSDARCKRVHNEGNALAAWVCEALITSSGTWSSCPDVDGVHLFPVDASCPVGFGADPEHPSECLTPQKCLARNSQLALGETTKTFTSACVGGCQMSRDTSTATVGVDGLYTGHYEYTGDACAANAPSAITPQQAKEPPAEKCQQNGSFKFCLKPNGDHCLSASNGRQACWRPGETGEKTDGPVLQKRNAGPTEIPPNLSLPNGDTLQKQGDSLTQTTTITKNSTTTNITTTTTNYTTQNGTNAGPKDQGQQADTGNPSSAPDGDGSEEGDKNGVGGDGSCTGGWQPSGDPVLGGILTESWKQRCNDEMVQSDMRTDAQTLADATPADGDPESVWAGDDSGAINEGWLVFGAGSCPVISISIPGVGPWSPPAAFCSVIAALAALFQLAAYLWALRIVSS